MGTVFVFGSPMTDPQQPHHSRYQQGANANDNAQINIGEQNNYYRTAESVTPRDRNEAILLEAVRTEVAGRQEFALHNRVYIELDKWEDPTQIIRPWEMDVKEGSAEPVRCPPDMAITQVFDRRTIGGRLLLLGAPGSGKTTMLLQLAEVLVDRAIADGGRPVPVLLNLSAWKKEFRTIREWMVADLKLKYGVRKSKAVEWIEGRRVVPLLDGLDELMSERQETCVRALNDFLGEEWVGSPLVVCSRLEEYGAYPTNLGLNGSVSLLPLSNEQIERFLQGSGCGWLWEVVKDDEAVMDEVTGLARSPLMLTVFVLASEGLRGQELESWLSQESETERQQLLLNSYVNRSLKRGYIDRFNRLTKKGKHPTRSRHNEKKVRQWIGWLARRLRDRDQTEIFIETLQPSLLSQGQQRLFFGLTGGLSLGSLLGSSHTVLWGLLYALEYPDQWMPALAYGLERGLVIGLTYGSVGGFLGGITIFAFDASLGKMNMDLFMHLFEIKANQNLDFSWHRIQKAVMRLFSFKRCFYILLTIPLGVFLSSSVMKTAIYVASVLQLSARVRLPEIPEVLILSLPVMIWIYFQKQLEVDVKMREGDNQGVWDRLKYSLLTGTFYIFSYTTVSSILQLYPTHECILRGVIVGSIPGVFLGGGFEAYKHCMLRVTLWSFGYSPWNYSRFLRYCTERGFLQRVGGGYRFVHALLRDYFADTEPCPGDPTAPPAR